MTISASLVDSTERLGSGNTIASIPIGVASPERIVVILGGTTDAALTGATIGGITAIYGQLDIGAARMAVWWARVPTGTTASLVTTGANPTYSHGVYAVYGAKQTAVAGNATIAASTTVNTVASGIVIALSLRSPAAAVAWPVLAEDFDRTIVGGALAGAAAVSGAMLLPTTTQTPMTVTATGASAVVAVSFEPSLFVAADAGSYALTGTAATPELGRKTVASVGSYALTGQAATLRRNLPIVAGAGNFPLAGQTATLRKAWKPAAGAGNYTLSGSAASTLKGIRVSAAAGPYALTGQDATLNKSANKTAIAGPGSYSLTGFASSSLKGWKPTAGVGAYTLTGQIALLRGARKVSASSGGYSLSGQAAALQVARRIGAAAGAYTQSGQAATLTKAGTNKSVVAGAGAYALSGVAATHRKAWRPSAGIGAYVLTGATATLKLASRASAGVGTYLLIGANATLIKASLSAYVVSASPCTYGLAGSTARLKRSGSLGLFPDDPMAVVSVPELSATVTVSQLSAVVQVPKQETMVTVEPRSTTLNPTGA